MSLKKGTHRIGEREEGDFPDNVAQSYSVLLGVEGDVCYVFLGPANNAIVSVYPKR